MSDEYITPTAVGAERNCSRSKVALQPDKTFRIAGSGGKTGSLFAMSRVIAIEQEHKPFKSENRRRASLSVAQTKYAEMIEWVQSLEIKSSVSPTITLVPPCLLPCFKAELTGAAKAFIRGRSHV